LNQRDELRKDVQAGLNQLDGGDFTEYDESSLKERLDEISRKGKRRLAERIKG
tara:strand:- start:1011 stop:1169 length:159 start_codon:yes stop_codon:yes gene_type:complete